MHFSEMDFILQSLLMTFYPIQFLNGFTFISFINITNYSIISLENKILIQKTRQLDWRYYQNNFNTNQLALQAQEQIRSKMPSVHLLLLVAVIGRRDFDLLMIFRFSCYNRKLVSRNHWISLKELLDGDSYYFTRHNFAV